MVALFVTRSSNVFLSFAAAGFLLLAGCAGPPAPGVAATGSETAAPSGASADPTGLIEGTVIDDERRPLAGAFVSVANIGQSALAADDGSFVLDGVPLGTHEVTASMPGFLSQAKRLDVFGEEPARVQFVLAPIPTNESYVDIFPHTSIVHYGTGDLNWELNNTGMWGGCESCWWINRAGRAPDAAFVEVYGKHAVSNPAAACDNEWYYLWQNAGDKLTTGDGGGRVLVALHGCLPMKIPLAKERIKDTTVFVHRLHCERTWFCLEERREVYLTLFHHSGIPEGFSVKPQ